jgi:hypothetical protein
VEPSGASELARAHLSAHLPERWRHIQKVASRASEYGILLPTSVNARLLESAAWLHDIGYAPNVAATGFHPLDGARFLQLLGASSRLVGLVAHHSSAASEAKVLGLARELAEFKDERTLVRDLLWYIDMTTGPDGTPLTFEDRMTEVRERYGANHYVVLALDDGMSERVAAVERARSWLTSVGLTGQV